MQGRYFLVFGAAERVRPVSCGDLRILLPAFQLKPEKVFTNSSLSELHALREKEVREEIAARLRSVCCNFSHDDFDRLVQQMAERQLRDERRLVW